MTLVLRAPRLASTIRSVRDDGGGSVYCAFPSAVLRAGAIVLAYKRGNHNHLPPQSIRIASRAEAFEAVWSTDLEVMAYDVGADRSPADPDLFLTSTGRLLLTTTYVNNGGAYYRQPHLSISDDGGATWTAHEAILSRFAEWDSPCRAVEIAGRIWLAHYGGEVGDVGFYRVGLTYSDDDGETWSAGPEIASGAATGMPFEEPGLAVLPDGRVLCVMRTDTRAQIFISYAADPAESWSLPTTVGRGYGKAVVSVDSSGAMCLIQRWPANVDGGQGVAFYSLELGDDGVVRGSMPAFLDPDCPRDGTRSQMYGTLVSTGAGRLLALWSTAGGNHYTQGATIYEAEVAI